MADKIKSTTITADIKQSTECLAPMDAGSMYEVHMYANTDQTVDVYFEKPEQKPEQKQIIPMVIVDALPASPDANTLYFVLEGQ